MHRSLPVVIALAIATTSPAARAAAPQLVPVQGVLLDSTGAAIDGDVTAVFSIYTSEVGGTALWSETQSVLVEDGLFTAYLGDVTTLDLTLFRDNGELWLGIQIESDAEMDRVLLGSNPFAGYAEHCGSAPAPDFADITGTLDPTDLPAGIVSGPLACTGTEKVAGIDSSGALVCAADTDTTYSAGTGLTLTGTTFSLDTSSLQARVTGTCGAGSSIATINSDGTVTCETDDDTTYSAGSGLTLTGTTFDVDTSALQVRVSGLCPSGQSIRSIGSDGSVVCELDDDTTYSAGSGLTLTGTTFSADMIALQSRITGVCASGSAIRQVLLDGSVLCETDDDTTYTTGFGLALMGTTLQINASETQRRVTGTCAAGSAIGSIGTSGTVSCNPYPAGDIEGVIAGSGLTGGGTSGTVAVSLNWTDVQRRVSGTCPINWAMATINSDGTVICQPVYSGDITAVNVGTGLTGGGTSGNVAIDVDTTYLQRRVTGTCAAGYAIRAIGVAGTVSCEPITGDITEVIAGTGLTGGGTSGSVTLSLATHSRVGSWYGTVTAVAGDNYAFPSINVTPPISSSCLVTATAWLSDQEPADDADLAMLRTARLTVGTGTQENDLENGPLLLGTGGGVGRPVTAMYSWTAFASTDYRFGCYVSATANAAGDTLNCRVGWVCHPY